MSSFIPKTYISEECDEEQIGVKSNYNSVLCFKTKKVATLTMKKKG